MKKYSFENIEIPVYFTIIKNKVVFDDDSMHELLDEKIKELRS